MRSSLYQEYRWSISLRPRVRVIAGHEHRAPLRAALGWLLTSPAVDGTTGRCFDVHRRELTGWSGSDRTDWADELYASSLALAGIERDPLRAAA